jgi:heme exporter protein B
MHSGKKITALVKKELLTELRQQYALFGVVLYVAATSFILYLAVAEPEKKVWNGLFWVLMLFVCVNTVARSFLQESRGRMLYFFTITGAREFIMAKLLFSSLLMAAMGFISWLLVQLLMGNPVQHTGLFLFALFAGSISLGLVFTLLSAIVARAQQNAAMMAILGFPLVIPLLLVIMRISQAALSANMEEGMPLALMGILLGYDLLVLLLSFILFPFIWKD